MSELLLWSLYSKLEEKEAEYIRLQSKHIILLKETQNPRLSMLQCTCIIVELPALTCMLSYLSACIFLHDIIELNSS